ncbi:MAG: hypothetical protein DMF14_11895 [Verrucomicrobia bacterium]|nr:MAG: hypothetical protein DMF14_11895 [Verrucomicrobiota bacterium]
MKKVIASCLRFRRSISSNYWPPTLRHGRILNKPPLLNWIVAASFKLSGVRNEWTARLPSALFTLAVALTLATVGRISLGPIGSFIAPLCWLTNLGLLSFCGCCSGNKSAHPGLPSSCPGSFLVRPAGERSKSRPVLLSYRWRRSLAKSSPPRPNSSGALHWSRGNARNFVTWLIPYFRALPSRSPLQAWSREAAVAFHGEEGESEDWLLNFPRGFAYLLPWVLLLPFIRLSKITDPLQRNVAYGLAWGSIIPFVIVLLTSGTLPRYILPLEAPFCWTVGSAVANGASQWSIKGIRVPQGPNLLLCRDRHCCGDDNLSAAFRDLFKEARAN